MKPQSQPILMENWYWFHGICTNNVLCHLLWSRTLRIGTTHVGDGSRKKMLNYEFMDSPTKYSPLSRTAGWSTSCGGCCCYGLQSDSGIFSVSIGGFPIEIRYNIKMTQIRYLAISYLDYIISILFRSDNDLMDDNLQMNPDRPKNLLELNTSIFETFASFTISKLTCGFLFPKYSAPHKHYIF